ncbi:MAG: 5-oxoprolinase, partial [Deltaproteobacteria bacterium]|nr:5-oxoprolinase [Deltaproteobacteria bacterium]
MNDPGDATRPPPRPEIWIDRGGTFTDCVLRDPASGRLSAVKVLSSAGAPLEGIRALLGLGPDAPLPPCDVRLGTTLVTNALLERRFARTLLVVTRGFGDVLAIGDQTRPELFALRVERPPPLHEAVLEVDARLGADGVVLARPDRAEVRRALAAARARGLECAAVLVVNAHLDGALERELGALCHEAGFGMVALSHEVAPRIGLVVRGETTVLHAALTPELRRHLQALEGALAGGSLRVLQSSGGLTGLARLRAPHAALSG